jgi:hypothetical protein
MRAVYNASDISNVIHLATAPVFLLTAIGTLLNVMTNRLGRIIDRTRYLENVLESAPVERIDTIHADLAKLSRRAGIMDLAITLFTFSGFLVCIVIAILFLGDFLNFSISIPVALLFVLAMLFLILGLLSFLREIFLATRTLPSSPNNSKRSVVVP